MRHFIFLLLAVSLAGGSGIAHAARKPSSLLRGAKALLAKDCRTRPFLRDLESRLGNGELLIYCVEGLRENRPLGDVSEYSEIDVPDSSCHDPSRAALAILREGFPRFLGANQGTPEAARFEGMTPKAREILLNQWTLHNDCEGIPLDVSAPAESLDAGPGEDSANTPGNTRRFDVQAARAALDAARRAANDLAKSLYADESEIRIPQAGSDQKTYYFFRNGRQVSEIHSWEEARRYWEAHKRFGYQFNTTGVGFEAKPLLKAIESPHAPGVEPVASISHASPNFNSPQGTWVVSRGGIRPRHAQRKTFNDAWLQELKEKTAAELRAHPRQNTVDKLRSLYTFFYGFPFSRNIATTVQTAQGTISQINVSFIDGIPRVMILTDTRLISIYSRNGAVESDTTALAGIETSPPFIRTGSVYLNGQNPVLIGKYDIETTRFAFQVAEQAKAAHLTLSQLP